LPLIDTVEEDGRVADVYVDGFGYVDAGRLLAALRLVVARVDVTVSVVTFVGRYTLITLPGYPVCAVYPLVAHVCQLTRVAVTRLDCVGYAVHVRTHTRTLPS